MEWYSEIDTSWTLFLDRDGVINRRKVGEYIEHINDFEFLPGVLDALVEFSRKFGVIVVVTNQQGIGKGIMSEEELLGIHQFMLSEVFAHGGRIDNVFYCPELAENDPLCRKPNTGMAFEARERYPEIDFKRSVMIGDMPSDMEFGERLGMKCIKIGASDDEHDSYEGLIDFAQAITAQ